MTAHSSKPSPRKRELKYANLAPFRKGRPDPQRDRHLNLENEASLRSAPYQRRSMAELDELLSVTSTHVDLASEEPVPSDREIQVITFFRRVRNVTLHVLDRASTFALRGAKYLDARGQ